MLQGKAKLGSGPNKPKDRLRPVDEDAGMEADKLQQTQEKYCRLSCANIYTKAVGFWRELVKKECALVLIWGNRSEWSY